MKKNNALWSLSLTVVCLCSLIWAGSGISGRQLPDVWIRVLGILDLIGVAVLAYTSIKKKRG